MATATDIGLLTTIIFIMFAVGGTLPFIEEQFNETGESAAIDRILFLTGQDTSILGIIASIAGMFFWDFGQRFFFTFFPLVLFFTGIKVVFYVILFKAIRGS